MKDEQVYLLHILDAIRQIEEYTAADRHRFFSSRLIQDGVIRNLEIIGEAVKNLSDEFRVQHPEIPWPRVAGLRDVLIHQYFKVDLETVWGVVQNRLPALKKLVESLLSDQRPDGNLE